MSRGAIDTARRLYDLGQLPLAGARRPDRSGTWKRPKTEIAPFYVSRPPWSVLVHDFEEDGQVLWGFGKWDATLPDGRTGRCFALDIDGPSGELWVQNACADDEIAHAFETTVRSRTARGFHWFFIDQSGRMAEMPNKAKLVPELDIRINGGYVLAPPSKYLEPDSEFKAYQWVNDHSIWDVAIASAPNQLVTMLLELNGRGKSRPLRRGQRVVETELADHPEGTRNETLIRYAGDLLSDNRHDVDNWQAACVEQGQRMGLDDGEITKTIQSALDMDQRNHPELWTDTGEAKFSPANGWLCPGGGVICAPVKIKDETGEKIVMPEPWCTFDFRVTGRVMDAAGTAVDAYEGTLARIGGSTLSKVLITTSDLSRRDRFNKWMAGFQVMVHPPKGDEYGRLAEGNRLAMYLASQDAPEIQYVDHFGWDDEAGWLCAEGEITPEGLRPASKRRPRPDLVEIGRYHYGFKGERAAIKGILQELLTFHWPDEAAVFASWVTAVIVKHDIMKHTAMFPFMAIEAPAETGKTEGMFSRMLKLSGLSAPTGLMTQASFRNFVSQHRNGVVWVDDADDPEQYHEILRQTTAEQSLTKMLEDKVHTATYTMHAAVAISGESLDIASQKALIDRRVFLEPRSPVERRSIHDSSVLQWVDVKAFDRQWGDLSDYAGWFVAEVLRVAPAVVRDYHSLRAAGRGRAGDALAVVRVGARILAGVSGEDWVVDRVDHWVDEQAGRSVENKLTLEILPTLIRQFGLPDRATLRPPSAMDRDLQLGCFPIWTDAHGKTWIVRSTVEAWWSHVTRRTNVRTDSAAAIRGQLRDVVGDIPAHEKPRVDGDANRRVYAWQLPDEVAGAILARAEGRHVSQVSREDGRGQLNGMT